MELKGEIADKAVRVGKPGTPGRTRFSNSLSELKECGILARFAFRSLTEEKSGVAQKGLTIHDRYATAHSSPWNPCRYYCGFDYRASDLGHQSRKRKHREERKRIQSRLQIWLAARKEESNS